MGTGILFAWALPLFTALSLGLAISLYYGEALALDWRRALTRRVSVLFLWCSLLRPLGVRGVRDVCLCAVSRLWLAALAPFGHSSTPCTSTPRSPTG